MAIALVQSANAASNAAGPASIAPAYGVGTTAGNLLILCVTNTNTTGTITTPAGWTLLQANSQSGLISNLYYQLSNAGGITTVTVTIGGTAGGAVATLLEFSGIGTATLDQNSIAGTTSNAFTSPTITTSLTGELCIMHVGYAAATLTPTASGEWSAPIGTVSTSGAPNAQDSVFWAVSHIGNVPTLTGALSASVLHAQNLTTFNVLGTLLVVKDNVGGLAGVYVGQFNQGMIGG